MPTPLTYTLPPNRIATYPARERHTSKLLLANKGRISDHTFSNLGEVLPEGAHVILNETKVLPVRLFFQKPTGGVLQVFLLEPADYGSMEQALARTSECSWNCLVGGLKKWKEGRIELKVPFEDGEVKVFATLVERLEDSVRLRFEWEGGRSWSEVLEEAGKMPLPPYIQRDAEDMDAERYQTVFSRIRGSVAAPTASLHFDEVVFDGLARAGVGQTKVCLHVGAGTFKPVTTEEITDHVMHQEYFQVELEAVEEMASASGPIIPVGTTACRTIESLYWLGLNVLKGTPLETVGNLGQWDWKRFSGDLPHRQEVFTALAQAMRAAGVQRFEAETSLMIAPGYPWMVTEGLITNFHQPGSTLLLLVAALIGDRWQEVYKHALAGDYRFLSYGDGSLLIP